MAAVALKGGSSSVACTDGIIGSACGKTTHHWDTASTQVCERMMLWQVTQMVHHVLHHLKTMHQHSAHIAQPFTLIIKILVELVINTIQMVILIMKLLQVLQMSLQVNI